MNSSDSYDQYADQLLNSVFQNVKQSTTPAATSHEDQLLNQFFQNQRYSNNMSSPPHFGNNNDWLLLQQLQQQQQQMLLERQFMSPLHQVPARQEPLISSPIHKFLTAAAAAAATATPIPTTTTTSSIPTSAITDANSPVPASAIAVIEEPAPAKKIARVPVPSLPEPKPIEEPVYQQILNTSSQPQLKKKKSFLRSLSSRGSKNKEFEAAAAAATAAMLAKSVHQQYKNKKQENIAKKTERAVKMKEREPVPVEVEEYLPAPPIERKPSFWRPREERPKGWWKGQRSHTQQEEYQQEYQEIEVEEDNEEEEESEEEPVVIVPPKKTKKVVVKRVAVPPKKIPSIKATKPKRPMAFKTPNRKTKSNEKKKPSEKEKADTTANMATQPMYVMPQQMYSPYYQQPMMVPQPYMPGGNGFYYMPNMTVPQNRAVEKEEEPQVRRQKSIYNPRESNNDKCTIM